MKIVNNYENKLLHRRPQIGAQIIQMLSMQTDQLDKETIQIMLILQQHKIIFPLALVKMH